MVRNDIKKIVREAAEKKFGEMNLPTFAVEVPENPAHGDYSTNIAMALARTLSAKGGSASGGKKNPLEIATRIH
ncbi:MAG: hypothetical protein HYW88_01840 [Candidatus Sungbacteria bacterium]|nr:hypothetical protein [Candidatus Sungbacteria bacterium]